MKHITLDQILAQPVEVQEALHDAWEPEKFDIVYVKGLGYYSIIKVSEDKNDKLIVNLGYSRGHICKDELIHLPTLQWLIDFIESNNRKLIRCEYVGLLDVIFELACYVAKDLA